MKHTMKNFGERIAARRKELRLSQEALANQLAISPQAVSKWENGIGLPDVTLFPAIAQALQLSIEALFTGEEGGKPVFPKVYPGLLEQELPRVAIFQDYACYALEAPVEAKDGIFYFADGSQVDMHKKEVLNRSKGEIRLLKGSPATTAHGETQKVKQQANFTDFDSLEIRLDGDTAVEIFCAKDGEPTLLATGTDAFLDALKAQVSGQTLSIVSEQTKGSESSVRARIRLALPFSRGKQLRLRISGCSDVKCQVDFEDVISEISGSGSVSLRNANTLEQKISGAGDLSFGEISERLRLTVSGAGSLKGDRAQNLSIAISGAGDAALGQVGGTLSLQISGSGTLKAAGKLSSLTAVISGAGTLQGEALETEVANLTVKGNADLTLGAITDHSVEKLGDHATLTVGRRKA